MSSVIDTLSKLSDSMSSMVDNTAAVVIQRAWRTSRPNHPPSVIDITERIYDFVSHVPADTVTQHGGASSLAGKIQDLIFSLEDDAPKKRGRPKGSKNKTKDVPQEVPSEPKKRGRPKGSKNNPKDASQEVPSEPKKRGRPKGSPNKPKETPTEVSTEPKKRGRPKGSLNKTL